MKVYKILQTLLIIQTIFIFVMKFAMLQIFSVLVAYLTFLDRELENKFYIKVLKKFKRFSNGKLH